MNTQLNKIAAIFTGATLRDKPGYALNSDSLLMQLGNLDIDGTLHLQDLLPFKSAKSFTKFIAQPNDLVFRGRGAGMNAVVLGEMEKPIIVAAPLVIVRPDINRVNPYYLAWAITNLDAHRHYTQYAQGSSILTGIGKNDLEELEINLPNLATQKKIAQLIELQFQEKYLLKNYQQNRTRFLDILISNAAAGTSPTKRKSA